MAARSGAAVGRHAAERTNSPLTFGPQALEWKQRAFSGLPVRRNVSPKAVWCVCVCVCARISSCQRCQYQFHTFSDSFSCNCFYLVLQSLLNVFQCQKVTRTVISTCNSLSIYHNPAERSRLVFFSRVIVLNIMFVFPIWDLSLECDLFTRRDLWSV